MLEGIQLHQILFLDIETVSGSKTYEELPERQKEHWKKKAQFLLRLPPGETASEEQAAASYRGRAAIFAEFGKVVCISIGYLHNGNKGMRLKSFCSADEAQLLQDFVDLLARHYSDPAQHGICGHNIKEFDIPFLCRRLLIHGIALPETLQLSGKKPWETKHLLDTMQLWKFGDVKNFTSLDLLASVLHVDTPKDDIDGSMVGQVYWEEQDLDRIATYCEKDVVTVAQVLLKMMGKSPIDAAHIISV